MLTYIFVAQNNPPSLSVAKAHQKFVYQESNSRALHLPGMYCATELCPWPPPKVWMPTFYPALPSQASQQSPGLWNGWYQGWWGAGEHGGKLTRCGMLEAGAQVHAAPEACLSLLPALCRSSYKMLSLDSCYLSYIYFSFLSFPHFLLVLCYSFCSFFCFSH